jgi:hypothetical protein
MELELARGSHDVSAAIPGNAALAARSSEWISLMLRTVGSGTCCRLIDRLACDDANLA